MVLPLPGALAQFSAKSLQNIKALDAITKGIPNPQSLVRDNVTGVVTGSVTSAPTEVFNGAPGFVNDTGAAFLDNVTTPPALSTRLQQQSLDNIFGSDLTSGASVDEFIKQNVKLEDVLPSQQIYQIAKNLGSHSMYTDPLQAYAQVAQATHDVQNLCSEASAVIADIEADIVSLLSLQTAMDYGQIPAMNQEFFASTGLKANAALAALTLVNDTFSVRGRFDPLQTANLCTLLNDLTNFTMFGNSKILQFDLLRKKIDAAINRLDGILKALSQIIAGVSSYIPEYAATALFGKLFQTVQKKVLEQSGVDLNRVIRDIEAFTSLNADDRSKVLVTAAIAATAQIIRAYLCEIQPSTQVNGPEPVITTLKSGYDTYVASLTGNPISSLLVTLEALISPFSSTMNAGVTRNNSAQLATSAASVTSTTTALAAALTVICASANTFKTLFKFQTSLDPQRVVGANELFSNIGSDFSRETLMGSKPGDFTSLALTESTSPGQLAASLQQKIAELPDGPQKDELVLVYADVYSRHRAIVLGMDFQRRESVRTFLAPSGEDEDRKIINDTIKTFTDEDFSNVEVFLK